MAGRKSELVRVVAGGLDHRWWQASPSTTTAVNAYPDQRGAMVKMGGWHPLTDWAVAWVGGKSHAAFGVYSRENATDLLVEYQGSIWLVVGESRYEIQSGRHVTAKADDAAWMSMVGDRLYICNGRDRNAQFDGRKVTPVGIASAPEAPEVIAVDITADIVTPGGSASPISTGVMTASATPSDDELQYAYTWVNESGAESNLGLASPVVSPTGAGSWFTNIWLVGDAPTSACVSRNLYRSADRGLTWYFIRRVPGTAEAFVQDYVGIGDEVSREAPEARSNDAPEPAWFAFEFRGRAYYQPASRPSQLDFSLFGSPEQVPLGNSVNVGFGDGDRITGYSAAEDYVILFKEESVYILTTGSDGAPIVRRLSGSAGCRGRFAAQSFEGRTYWLGRDGIYATNGASVARVTDAAQRVFLDIPQRNVSASVSWVDQRNRLVVFSVPMGPEVTDKQWLMLKVDDGTMTVARGVDVTAATLYQGRVLLSALHPDSAGSYDIVAQGHGDERDGEAFTAEFQTQWFDMRDPTSEKAVTRVDVVYAQRCNASVAIEVYVDWDERVAAWSGTVSLSDPDAPLWDAADYTSGSSYDLERMRTTRVDITPPADGSRVAGRSFALRIAGDSDNEPWSVVGFRVYYDDVGSPAHGGLDQDGTC